MTGVEHAEQRVKGIRTSLSATLAGGHGHMRCDRRTRAVLEAIPTTGDAIVCSYFCVTKMSSSLAMMRLK
jgi:hypothetical protein